jgi:hypothetical protein
MNVFALARLRCPYWFTQQGVTQFSTKINV